MRPGDLRFAAATLLLLAAACATPASLVTPSAPPVFRNTSSASPTVILPAATAVPEPSPIARPTATTTCQNNASFLEDLTIPDGSQVLTGALLDKRWSVMNSGTCDWGPDYRLVQVGTSEIQGPAEIALYPARAGSTAEWQVNLQAPREPGEYLARWQARAPDGTLFGDEVFVLIEVAAPEPTATVGVTPTP